MILEIPRSILVKLNPFDSKINAYKLPDSMKIDNCNVIYEIIGNHISEDEVELFLGDLVNYAFVKNENIKIKKQTYDHFNPVLKIEYEKTE